MWRKIVIPQHQKSKYATYAFVQPPVAKEAQFSICLNIILKITLNLLNRAI